jgi:hypothetical protein
MFLFFKVGANINPKGKLLIFNIGLSRKKGGIFNEPPF